VNTTGIASRPLTKLAGRSGSAESVNSGASLRSGSRVRSVRSIVVTSRRASWLPRQKCVPKPKARWLLGFRSMRKCSGSPKTCSSKFADSNSSTIFSPARNCVPWNSASAVSVRAMFFTGEVHRSISSTAAGTKASSVTNRSH